MPYYTKQKKEISNVKNPSYHFTVLYQTGIAKHVTESEYLEVDGENVVKAAAAAGVAAVSLLAAGVTAPIAALLVAGVWKWMTG